MSTIDFAALAAPFPASDLEWRVQSCGKSSSGKLWARVVPYVTNRAIQERLDQVVGPAAWRNEYRPGPAGGVLCGLAIRVDGEWVTKFDGAENTDIESVKGGLSAAMKRAAVQWGMGRHLYTLDDTWGTIHANGRHFGQTKDGERFRWDPPALPGVSGRSTGPERPSSSRPTPNPSPAPHRAQGAQNGAAALIKRLGD